MKTNSSPTEVTLMQKYKRLQVLKYLRDFNRNPLDVIIALVNETNERERTEVASNLVSNTKEMMELTGLSERSVYRRFSEHGKMGYTLGHDTIGKGVKGNNKKIKN